MGELTTRVGELTARCDAGAADLLAAEAAVATAMAERDALAAHVADLTSALQKIERQRLIETKEMASTAHEAKVSWHTR